MSNALFRNESCSRRPFGAVQTSLILALFFSAGCGGHGTSQTTNFGNVQSSNYFAVQRWATGAGTTEIERHQYPNVLAAGVTDPAASYNSPDFCPLSDSYVFVGATPGATNTNIYEVTPTSTTPTLLTQTNHNHYSPRFTPDGQNVVFAEDMGDGTRQIFRVPFGPGIAAETRLTQTSGLNNYPTVSFDGETVAFSSTSVSVNPQLFTVPLLGGNLTRITSDGLVYRNPEFSLDGTKIYCAYGSNPPFSGTESLGIGSVNIATGVVTSLVAPVIGMTAGYPRLISSGTDLAYDVVSIAVGAGGLPNTGQVFVLPLNSTTPMNLSQGGNVFNEALGVN